MYRLFERLRLYSYFKMNFKWVVWGLLNSNIYPKHRKVEYKENVLVNEKSKNGGTVILNVGGKIHQVRWETIDKFPRSRLQKIRYATSEGKG